MIDYIYLLIICSLTATNLFTFFLYRKKPQKSNQSMELAEFMSDLLQGQAVVKVTRVVPTDIFLRSPRGRT